MAIDITIAKGAIKQNQRILAKHLEKLKLLNHSQAASKHEREAAYRAGRTK